MRVLMLTVLSIMIFATFGWTRIYSCRDNQGQLHFSDNLQGLPAKCSERAGVVKPQSMDNLNLVPVQDPDRSSAEFLESIKEADQEIFEKKLRVQQLKSNARELLERYQDKIEEKRKARRKNTLKSKQELAKIYKDIKLIRGEKKSQEQELLEARISSQDKQSVQEILNLIPD